MAALLVAMSVMAVMMTVAMPVWKHMSQREKEAELIFRGQQYARAIELLQKKIPGALPPNIDLLVTQKFLRKKYKDPITGQDFDTVTPLQAAPPTAAGGAQQPGGRGGPMGAAGAGRSNTPPTPSAPATVPGAARPGAVAGGAQAGIIGVVSKSKDTSIRLYNGRSHYNEWIFQAVQRAQTPGGTPGAPTPGQPAPGGRGQPPGGGRGGPGMPPPGGRRPTLPAPPGLP